MTRWNIHTLVAIAALDPRPHRGTGAIMLGRLQTLIRAGLKNRRRAGLLVAAMLIPAAAGAQGLSSGPLSAPPRHPAVNARPSAAATPSRNSLRLETQRAALNQGAGDPARADQ